MRKHRLPTGSIVAAAAIAIAACSSGGPMSSNHGAPGSPDGGGGGGGGADGGIGSPGSDGGEAAPFEADTPAVYVAKVKNILTGLAPTTAEVAAVTADPKALSGLIDTWMATPEYTTKMLRFFELAFQQTQLNSSDFSELIPNGMASSAQTNYLVENTQESLARTALALAALGKPVTDAFTTHSFMMTPALMELYAFMDQNQVTNTGGVTDMFAKANAKLTITVEADAGVVPFTDTINPASANYMHWPFADLAKSSTMAGCATDPRTYPAGADTIHQLLYGALANTKTSAGIACGGYSGSAATATQFTDTDFTTWSMVTIRVPKSGETTTTFFDLPSLRKATELVLNTPRVGFFTTPAFEANWQTNNSNQMRVTTNQALIVATGAQVDGTDPTVPSSTPGLDSTHAAPGTACYGCHQTLDPTRSILQATYSYGYGMQTTSTIMAQPGLFAFQGVTAPIKTIDDFATTLASHPLVANAWAEKLCYYANSVPCAADDPEFQRIVTLWKASNLSWNVLVKALLSSPITTNAASTKTATVEGEVASVSRRDHLCALLNARLGLTDVCNLRAMSKPLIPTIGQIASGLPSDAYGRGATTPLLPVLSSLFYRAGTENICSSIAQEIIDPTTTYVGATATHYTGTDPTTAIAAFVSQLMGLTGNDPRASAASTVLTSHFQSSVSGGAKATDALRSTFVVACLSPSVVGMGM